VLPEGKRKFAVLPRPKQGALDSPSGILGRNRGMGVITIGQIVAMAAHLEGKGATVLDDERPRPKIRPGDVARRIAPSPGELHSVGGPAPARRPRPRLRSRRGFGSEALSKI